MRRSARSRGDDRQLVGARLPGSVAATDAAQNPTGCRFISHVLILFLIPAHSRPHLSNPAETLFAGRQDAMQRATIPPLTEHFKGHDTAGLRILDAACGTGRVATFLRDNFPGSDVTALDLSPFYLEEAREINREWERLRNRGASSRGGSMSFMMAPVERMPFPDGHFDAVTCVYLFHELPNEVRECTGFTRDSHGIRMGYEMFFRRI